jgi:hypothetical protein
MSCQANAYESYEVLAKTSASAPAGLAVPGDPEHLLGLSWTAIHSLLTKVRHEFSWKARGGTST